MLAGIVLAEPAAAATLRRLARRPRAAPMDASSSRSARRALFGGMTVALRPALARRRDPLWGRSSPSMPALGVALVAATIRRLERRRRVAVRARRNSRARRLADPVHLAIREAGPSRASATVGMAPLFAVTFALVLLGEPLVAGIALGAVLIVGGGVVLASERGAARARKTIGLVFALAGAVAFALRDTFVRWLVSEATDVAPVLAASGPRCDRTVVSLAFVAGDGSRHPPAASRSSRPGSSASRTCRSTRRSSAAGSASSRRSSRPSRSGASGSRGWSCGSRSASAPARGRRLLVVAGGILIGLYR